MSVIEEAGIALCDGRLCLAGEFAFGMRRLRIEGEKEMRGVKSKTFFFFFFGREVGSCKSLKAFNADPRVGGGQRSGIFMKAQFPASKG